MDVLKLLDTVWPSAARAWELLHGSKANFSGAGVAGVAGIPAFEPTSTVSNLTGSGTRNARDRLHKRSAETFLDDDSATFFASAPLVAAAANHAPVSVSSAAASGPALQYGQAIPSSSPTTVVGPHHQHASSMNQTPSFYVPASSWPSEPIGPFSGSLSTSGLPQQYSTGFVDRLPPLSSASASASAHAQQQPRYPQFWNDYSALSPLGMPYGSGETQSRDSRQQPPLPPPSASLYPLQDQYSMFGMSLHSKLSI
jgi:hypothetical protein